MYPTIKKIIFFLGITFITEPLSAALTEDGLLSQRRPSATEISSNAPSEIALAGKKRSRSIVEAEPVVTAAPTKSKSTSIAALSRLAKPKVSKQVTADTVFTRPTVLKKPRTERPLTAPAPDRSRKPVVTMATYKIPAPVRKLKETKLTAKGQAHHQKTAAYQGIIADLMVPTPSLETITQSKKLDQAEFTKLFQRELQAKFGRGKIFTMPNRYLPLLCPEALRGLCTKIILEGSRWTNSNDSILCEHSMDYVIGSIKQDTLAKASDKIRSQYESLDVAIARAKPPLSFVYKYVTIEQRDLPPQLEDARVHFETHPEVTLVLRATKGDARHIQV